MIRILLALIIFTVAAGAQCVLTVNPVAKVDRLTCGPGAASSSVTYSSGSGAPSANCTAGTSVYLDTSNQRWYFCRATNTWQEVMKTYSQASPPATCTIGEMWFDTDATAGENLYLCTASNTWSQATQSSLLYGSTATVAVTNTTTETTLAGSGFGTLTLPAGYFTVGKTVTLQAEGYYSTHSTPGTLNLKLKLGSTIVGQTTALTPSASMTNQYWRVSATITARTIGASGTVIVQSAWEHVAGSTALLAWPMTNTSTVTIDTTTSQVLDLTATWGTANANNSISATNLISYTAAGSQTSVGAYTAGTQIVITGYSVGVDTTNTPEYLTASGTPSANCTQGRSFYTDTATSRIYWCSATNTWSILPSTTLTQYLTFPAGACQAGTAGTAFNTPSSNAPSAACVTGTNSNYGVIQFDPTTDESVQGLFRLPPEFTGAIDVQWIWRAAATTGDVVWRIDTAAVADAETGDPSWNVAAGSVTDTAKGTTLQWNEASMTSITITGAAAGETLLFRLYRDADNAADTMTGDAELISVRFTTRRTY